MWSPPNFSREQRARGRATIASPTTAAAGTTVESVRSRSAWAGCLVSVSTERSGLVRVEIGLITAPTARRGPVGHPAGPRAGVGSAEVAVLLRPKDLVVGLRARAPGDVPGLADRDALDRLDRGDGAGEAAVEAGFPGDVGAEPGDEAEDAALEGAAEALVCLAQAVDLGHHRLARLGIEAADRVVVDPGEVDGREVRARRPPDRGRL